MEEIGIKTEWGTEEPLTDNSILICIRCGVGLTDENVSQWSDVIEKTNKTQKVCKDCLTLEEEKIK